MRQASMASSYLALPVALVFWAGELIGEPVVWLKTSHTDVDTYTHASLAPSRLGVV